MIATNTTVFFVTKTARLRAAWRRADPYTAGSLLLISLIVVGGLIRESWPAARAAQPTIVFATSAPTGAQHGLTRPLSRAPSAFRIVPTLVPTVAPLAPTAAPPPPVEQPITIQNAPAEQTAPQWHADPLIVQRNSGTTAEITVPADAPRLCTGFGDWRDFDAMFAASPVCHEAAP